MSTHRTRNQQRQQQSGSVYPSQQLINSPMTPPKTFGKGIVIPIITDIVLCIAVCVARPIINKNTDLHLPFRIVPLSILAAFLIAVFIVVSYILKQYKYLKRTYQDLEQGMAVAAELNARQGDYVEYSVNPPYYNNAYNNGIAFPQNQPIQQTSPQTQSRRKSSSGTGCAVAFMVIITLTAVAGLLIYQCFPQNMDIKSCELTTGTVTDVVKSVYEDEENTYTTYYVDYTYNYAGKEYEGHYGVGFSVQKGEVVDVLVDSSKPQYSILPGQILFTAKSWGISVLISVAVITLLVLRTKLDKK